MNDLCDRYGKNWVCTLRRDHEGPCPLWPVRRPRRFMCRVFGHDFSGSYLPLVGRIRCRRCGYPRYTEASDG